MFETFGSHEVAGKKVSFQVFYPGPQMVRRGGEPRVRSLSVYGDFQPHVGALAWSSEDATPLERTSHPEGTLYTAEVGPLPDGFYQYKYLVEFEDGERRIVGDPCARYSGDENENSAFVIGGSTPQENAVPPLLGRRPLRDLVIYELPIDDFSAELRGAGAPIDAVTSQLDYIKSLGCNAVETLPWTAWPGDDYSWGYNPFMYFAVENRLVNDPTQPSEKLSRLKRFIRECHARGMHVIMDGVFNHVERGLRSRGFSYSWLYQDSDECPFLGAYAETGYLEDLDFASPCTQRFILDVCLYFMTVFQIDGLRLDYTKGYYLPEQHRHGLQRLIEDVNREATARGLENFSVTIEHIDGYRAIDVANKVGAQSCWYDELYQLSCAYLSGRRVDGRIVRALNTSKDFDPGRVPTIYIENHDHSRLAHTAGGRSQYYRTQPYAIALFTCPGAVLIFAGQELGEDDWIPEPGEETDTVKRVMPRPIRWNEHSGDEVARRLGRLYRRLAAMRSDHPSLSGPNFYPDGWDESVGVFDAEGYGVDAEKQVVIYHRWGPGAGGELERFMVVLNFSEERQVVDIPFPDNGPWEDLLSGETAEVSGYWLRGQGVESSWGYVFFKRGS